MIHTAGTNGVSILQLYNTDGRQEDAANSDHFVCNTVQIDLCTWQRVFAHGNTEYDTLFPSLLYTLAVV
jgi:hypothetical protein